MISFPHQFQGKHEQNKGLALALLAGPVFAVAQGLALVPDAYLAYCDPEYLRSLG